MSVRFHGLSAFPLTPADEEGVVDVEALSRLIDRAGAAQVDSIGLLGSTGSYVYFSREQRRRAVEAAAECLKGSRPLLVGVGTLRTNDAVLLAKDAEAAGANALLLAPVSYAPLTQEEVYHHFAAVAGATSLPLCIYNNPSTTHFTFSDELLVRLAYIPHILAVKMPLAVNMEFKPELERLRPRLGDNFSIGYSGDWGCADAVLQGNARSRRPRLASRILITRWETRCRKRSGRSIICMIEPQRPSFLCLSQESSQPKSLG